MAQSEELRQAGYRLLTQLHDDIQHPQAGGHQGKDLLSRYKASIDSEADAGIGQHL